MFSIGSSDPLVTIVLHSSRSAFCRFLHGMMEILNPSGYPPTGTGLELQEIYPVGAPTPIVSIQ
jgi:hypothetical protein